MTAALDIRDLSVAVKATGAPVLRQVSMTVEPGSIHGLVGESGAGKSTLAKAILGILPKALQVTGGAIRVAGHDHRASHVGRSGEIAFIPQDPLSALNPSRKIGAQLGDAMDRAGRTPRADRRQRMIGLLRDVRIHDPERVLDSYPHQLSGGMRQRVLIASAFSTEPRLILADEPTTALDVTVQKQVLKLIRDMQYRHDAAIVFVTHDLGVVAQICDTVTVLYAGMVVEQAPAAQVFGEPAHAYTRALMDASPRFDRPELGMTPISEATFEQLESEVARFAKEKAS
ncbi:MAG: ABC transporter ATP-binding protein [Minwuia sp.]|uniref:ABC transporter ATP-binding protein n=1 Tax=Minwuia sp. TaxID=2493630 RepID=UPI003A87EC85